MIEVEGLTKFYGPHPAITDVSLSLIHISEPTRPY